MTKLKFLDLTSNASDTPNKFEEPEQCLEDVVNKLQELKELRMRLPEVDRFEMWDQAINPEKMKLIAVNIPNVTELNVGHNKLGMEGA